MGGEVSWARNGPASWRGTVRRERLGEVLVRWSEADAKPLVLFVDEIDSLVGDTLLSVMRQLLAGYVRPGGLSQTWYCAACGACATTPLIQRGVGHDRRGSAFNVKARSLRMGDFCRDDVIECKVLHRSLEQTIREGLEQAAAYLTVCAARAGHLVIGQM